ncbi:MAG: DUF4405 domain-containing protein [Clostridia bacterium]|nr:DUF4405 domain-containing protein [Clostridia bacterium]
MKNKLKRILDIVMTLALPCLMAYELIGEATHEILGLCMVALFILHHALNWNWHKRLFQGQCTAFRAVLTVLDILMILVFINQAVTGIMMAKHVFPDLPHVGGRSFARVLHLLGAYWGFALCCFHAGMHMTGLLRKWKKQTGAAKIILPVLALGISAYGVYAFIHRDLPTYMTLQEQFVFFDYDEPLALFFLDYAAIMALLILLGCGLGYALQNVKRRNRA